VLRVAWLPRSRLRSPSLCARPPFAEVRERSVGEAWGVFVILAIRVWPLTPGKHVSVPPWLTTLLSVSWSVLPRSCSPGLWSNRPMTEWMAGVAGSSLGVARASVRSTAGRDQSSWRPFECHAA